MMDINQALLKDIQAGNCRSVPPSLLSSLTPGGSHAESWTDEELETWFKFILQQSESAFCLIIDGLDEVEERADRLAVAQVVRQLPQRHQTLKICCASRPEAPFATEFKNCSTIRLQDFNAEDIRKDCELRLASTAAERFINSIAEDARGVFLWASLIAADLAQACANGVDDDELSLRYSQFPAELSAMFRHMLRRLDEFDTRHPKPYLRLVQYARLYTRDLEVNLLVLMLATLPKERAIIWDELNGRLPDDLLLYLEQQIAGFRPRVISGCAGLVECVAKEDYSAPDEPDLFVVSQPLRQILGTAVVPIHRSVDDFLREDEFGISFIAAANISDQEAASRLIRSFAALMFTSEAAFDGPKGYESFEELAFAVLSLVPAQDCSETDRASLDAFFRKCVTRIAIPEGLYSIGVGHAPELSIYDNICVLTKSVTGCAQLVTCDLDNMETNRRAVGAVLATINWNLHRVNYGALNPSNELPQWLDYLTTLRQHISALDDYTIVYGSVEEGEYHQIARCSSSVFEHIMAACTRCLLPGAFTYNVDKVDDIRAWIERLLEAEYDGRSCEECTIWLWLSTRSSGELFATPIPDRTCSSTTETSRTNSIFECTAFPSVMKTKGAFPLRPRKWKSAGFDSFLDLDDALQQQACRIHTHQSWTQFAQAFREALSNLWKICVVGSNTHVEGQAEEPRPPSQEEFNRSLGLKLGGDFVKSYNFPFGTAHPFLRTH